MLPRLGRLCPALLVSWLVSACASGGASEGGPPSELQWTVGVYRLTGTLTYRNDSDSGEFVERVPLDGEVTVGTIGPLTMIFSTGGCRDPDPTATQRDRDRQERTFLCGPATVRLRPMSENVRAEATIPVTERTRGQGRCVQYRTLPDGSRICSAYEYRLNSRQVAKTVRLRGQKIR